VTNSEVSNDLPDKPTSDNEQPDEATSDKEQPGKPPSNRNLKSRLRARLRLIGGALASIAAVGAIAGGLVGYWNVWKTLRTDVFPEKQQTQREATARPDIIPRLSLVVLPFANLNNDPEQDYFADSITTDLTTDLAQMPGAFVIGRGTAFTYKNKQVDVKTLGKELGIRWAVQGAVGRNGDHVRVNVSLTDLPTGRDVWSDRFDGDRTNPAALQDQITARLARSLDIELTKPKAAVAKRTDPGIQTPWTSACARGQSSMSAGRNANCAGKGPIRQCAAPRPGQRRCNDRESVVLGP
jgi:adenylate cyclase